MRLKYTGHKPLPYILPTPVPLARLSDRTGELVFNPICEVRDDWAQWLIDHGAPFIVPPSEKDERTEHVRKFWAKAAENKRILAAKNAGRWFTGRTGKATANRFIKDNHLQGFLEARKFIPYGGYVLIAIPAVAGGTASISAPPEGQGATHVSRNWRNTQPIHQRDLDSVLAGAKFRRDAHYHPALGSGVGQFPRIPEDGYRVADGTVIPPIGRGTTNHRGWAEKRRREAEGTGTLNPVDDGAGDIDSLPQEG